MSCNGEILTLLVADFYDRSFTDAVKAIVNETAHADTMAADSRKRFPLCRLRSIASLVQCGHDSKTDR